MITLIVGSTGAGKTTYARRLAEETSAVVYSIDNWMKALYWQDMPEHPDIEWFQSNHTWYTDRIARCEDLIKDLSYRRARLHQPSLLDLGFSTAKHRQGFIDFYKGHGIAVDIHFLNPDPKIRWERVQKRNRNRGETFVMEVDSSMFDYMESIFQPPSSEDGVAITLIPWPS